MKYYSEKMKKFFDTEELCSNAELEYEAQLAEVKAKKARLNAKRAERAKEVEAAYQNIIDANKAYRELRRKFIEDYGTFHMTFSNKNDGFAEFFEDFFRIF